MTKTNMSKTEANLLLSLFFIQHEGKRLSDVIPNAKPFSVIHSFDGEDICDETGHLILWCKDYSYETGHIILWCKDYSYDIRMEVSSPIGQDVKIITINLLDYISNKDLI